MNMNIQSYEVIRQIGIGGMGIVYLAKHRFRNEMVAIKSLSPQYAQDEGVRKRFIQEAKILNELQHPNIVRVLDFIELPGELHLVMEYIEGRTLSQMIGKEVGPIIYEKAIPLFLQILEGIKYAHSKGIVHRDIKPSNILITPDNQVKITDFGIARIEGAESHTKTGTKMGTLFYMSPEQIHGKNVDERSDIYSLGVTLYEMLAGRLPFSKEENTSEFAIMNIIVNDDFPDPREYYPGIPQWLVSIIKVAISKNPRQRISVEEFIRLIDPRSKGMLIPKPVDNLNPINSPESRNDFAENSARRTPKKIYISFSILIPIIGLLLFFYFYRTDTAKNANSESALLPKLTMVKGGWFSMGSDSRDAGTDEKPIHKVFIDDFFIGTYEVTQSEWELIMGSNPAYFNQPEKPVEQVSWYEVQEYITKLNLKTGKHYRLPTEAEWEYAAKGGQEGRGYRYSGSNESEEVGWSITNSSDITHHIGAKKPNELGVYDMSGNVFEWCNDMYDGFYYINSPERNPKGGTIAKDRVIRGGSWKNNSNVERTSFRGNIAAESRRNTTGFRLAQDI